MSTAAQNVPTPSLVIDEERLDDNIAGMAAFAARAGLALRPHVKTHKSVEIARRQVAAGAIGITVATISEAEVFATAGMTDIFIAYPLWLDDDKARRLREILQITPLLIGIDSVEGAARLASGTEGLTNRLSVLVEIDSGHHRSGVSAAEAGHVASAAAGLGLDVVGVFTFPGHSYSPEKRQAAAADEMHALAAAVAALAGEGITARIVSGGSTPSVEFADASVLTDLRPGVYVFGDAQQWELGTCSPESIALTVLATVVSRTPERVVADAGSKALAADRGAFSTGFGRLLDHPEARLSAISEHHVTITGLECAPGTRLRVVPNHVCNAVNLADAYVVMREGQIVATWPVDARGRNI
ncbi:alanine racemase [Cryobacterium roopkundense]|uniref:Alanine racemase n=1 Tax=Cryobacterium roopkundense TaxID=1001240 RepID=A0A099J816_9MICO|nr:alanine racemase [Cryobacterium roopkundense]KGJ74240.1 alanine racemase [Cryobacterium roopkundense]MBB5641455.1 D-serine deaminase-like pyridoxal phosphate-dependent protein [Cryobacterium roopkundense]